MKAFCVSRAIWVAVVVLALHAQAPLVMADTCGVPDGYFKGGKPPARLRDPKCDTEACKKAMKNLQAAVDDCYAMQLAEAQKQLNSDNPPTGSGKAKFEKQQSDALQALGNPKDGGAGAIKTQKENTDKDAKDPANKKKSAKNVLKDKITQLLKDLDDCEANCPPPPEPNTPTPGPDDGGGGGGKQPKPPPVQLPKLPTLPDCWKTGEKEKFDAEWSEAEAALLKLRKANMPEGGGLINEDAVAQINAAFKELNALKAKEADVKPCGGGGGGGGKGNPPKRPRKAPRVATGHNVSYGDGPVDDFCDQIANHKIDTDIVGTGETIGHVADAIIENLTDQPIEVTVPPTVLESKSEKNQHYACPHGGDTVEVPPHGKKTVPLDGVCLARNKPPVGDGVHGDLAIGDCDPTSKIGQDQVDRMREISQYIYDAADRLEEEGLLNDIPYKDPEKRKDIVKQWATWMDPEISDITGAPPATKDDLKKVVYKQAGPMTPDKQAKIDDGIDKIFDKIELTTDKAKDLEKSDQDQDENPPIPPGSYNVSDETPTPAPQTQEKKPKKDKEQKKKKYPKAIQDWLDEVHKTDSARRNWESEMGIYERHLWDWVFKNSPHAKELYDKWKEAQKKALKSGATEADRDAEKKALEEFEKQVKELEKDFQKTDQGKDDYKNAHDAEKELDKQKEAEKAAEKKVPDYVDKEAIKEAEPVVGKW